MNRKSAWATHNGLRTTASEHLVDAALATGVSTFVKESVSFVYPDGGDRWVDETTPPAEDVPMLLPTLAGEKVADRFAAGGGRAVVLRFASFYGPSARSIDEALRMARRRMAMQSGKGFVSAIHTDDVASAAVAALDVPGGIYNVADDEPLTKREYVDAFSAAFGLQKLRIPPAWMAQPRDRQLLEGGHPLLAHQQPEAEGRRRAGRRSSRTYGSDGPRSRQSGR